MPQLKKHRRKQFIETEEQQIIHQKYNNIFFVLFIVYEVAVIILNGFFVRPQAYTISSGIDNALFNTTGALLLLLIGFGLYFTYLRSNIWSGIGFTLLITALTFQSYFLINGFWTRVGIQNNGGPFSKTIISAYLSNQNYSNNSTDTLGATAIGAIKCALALCVAFAGMGGRAGYLQAFIVFMIGSIVYELNRQLITIYATDYGGTISVFLFGGAMGTVLGILLSRKGKNEFAAHAEYVSKKFNRTLSLIGAAFCWVFFPVLNMDITPQLFIYSNAGLSTIYCISASVVTMVGLNMAIDKRLDVRNIITAPIAGGVIVGSSSANIYNPLAAILMGILAAIMQYVFNKVQIWHGIRPLHSHSVVSLFCLQGLIGGIVSSSFPAINYNSGSFSSLYGALSGKFSQQPTGQLIAACFSLGIGLCAGFLAYPLIHLVNRDMRKTFYQDRGHWMVDEQGLHEGWVDEPEAELQRQEGSQHGYKGTHSYL